MDLYYEGTNHLAELERASEDNVLAFEIGLGGGARFIRDMVDGKKCELIYWNEDEFIEEPGLFQEITIWAIELNATIRRMTHHGEQV